MTPIVFERPLDVDHFVRERFREASKTGSPNVIRLDVADEPCLLQIEDALQASMQANTMVSLRSVGYIIEDKWPRQDGGWTVLLRKAIMQAQPAQAQPNGRRV